MASLVLVTGPTLEPLSVAVVKAHARITTDAEDALVAALISNARQVVEEDDNLALLTQTWEYSLDAFPSVTRDNPDGTIVLPRPPVQSVTSITYTDEDGVAQTHSASLYTLDSRSFPGRIVPAYDEAWPSTRAVPNAVIVKYVAGFGGDEADVPERIRQAMLIMIATGLEHREDLVTGTIVAQLRSVRSLRTHYRTPGA